MDVKPGHYTYYCDVHTGMVGDVDVVADSEAIPSPAEAAEAGRNELGAFLNQGYAVAAQMSTTLPTASKDGKVEVSAGNGATGRATVEQFAPGTVIIQPGDTVTWTNPEDSVEVHFINSLPYDPAALPEAIPDKSTPPRLYLGPGFL